MSDSKLAPNSYDEVPYSAKPFVQTHPDRLATIATLFGLSPPPPDRCRVLEIGCGRGGNLIPMAEQLGNSNFVGIDLSTVQIREARDLTATLALGNIEFKQLNILDLDRDFGDFDYIICHGVYSWVPRAVQDKILQVCSTHLSAQGIVYLSYNVYPGWHMRGMIRDMMCYHTAQYDDAMTRVGQARALLELLARNTHEGSPYGAFLRSELQALHGHEDAYLFHEHLEEHNEPIYFFQFMKRANAHGLDYLGEADISTMYSGYLQPHVRTALEGAAKDWVQMEQYMDFLRNRMFRQTLLCHQGATIDRELKPQTLDRLRIAARFVPTEKRIDWRSNAPLTFKHHADGRTVTSKVPLMKAALIILAEAWPQSVACAELLDQSYAMARLEPLTSTVQYEETRGQFSRTVYDLYLAGMIEIHAVPVPCAKEVGTRPLVSKLARHQALSGNLVTTLRHESRTITEFARQLLPYLDGTRGRDELLEVVDNLVRENILLFPTLKEQTPAEDFRSRLCESVDMTIKQIAANALLMAN